MVGEYSKNIPRILVKFLKGDAVVQMFKIVLVSKIHRESVEKEG